MTKTQELLELAERCEQASEPDRVLDAEIYVDLDPELENRDALAINGQVGSWVPDFTASLDAAMTLTVGLPAAVERAVCAVAYQRWSEGDLTPDRLARCISAASLRARSQS